jgi:hypothetical protein
MAVGSALPHPGGGPEAFFIGVDPGRTVVGGTDEGQGERLVALLLQSTALLLVAHTTEGDDGSLVTLR